MRRLTVVVCMSVSAKRVATVTNTPARTKAPTVAQNPDKKALYGYVPARSMYRNWRIPEARTKTR